MFTFRNAQMSTILWFGDLVLCLNLIVVSLKLSFRNPIPKQAIHHYFLDIAKLISSKTNLDTLENACRNILQIRLNNCKILNMESTSMKNMNWNVRILQLDELEHLNMDFIFNARKTSQPTTFRFPPLHQSTPLGTRVVGDYKFGHIELRISRMGKFKNDRFWRSGICLP